MGNFDHVFRDHVEAVYAPLLAGLEEGDAWPVTIHLSGPLLDWLEHHEPSWVDRLGALVTDGSVELLAAGHDEPILVALSPEDRVEQVVRHRERLAARFGVEVRGLWLTERVWEGDLPRDLVRAGIRFVVVDDRHLRVTGIPTHDLHRPWITEFDGHHLTVVAIDQRLRYLVPFRPASELAEHLTALRQAGHAMAVLADDGEKFGGWPGTAKWVWEEGWFSQFTATLRQLREQGEVELSTLADAIATVPSRGPVYLPSASYHEMERWALPAMQARRLERLEEAPLLPDPGADDEALLRGGHWKHFLARYPESNRLHKVMAHLSRLSRERGDPPDVRRHIGRAQCNDAYWHGVFGGLYLPFLRAALWRELAEAARRLFAGVPIHAEVLDLDADGHCEVLLTGEQVLAVVAPSRGGAVEVLLDLASGRNFADSMTRHEEAYHPTTDATPDAEGGGFAEAAGGTASIHDLETSLAERPPLDAEPRALFVDRFVAATCGVDDFASGNPTVTRSLADEAMVARVETIADGRRITLEGSGIVKELTVWRDGSLDVTWRWTPRVGERFTTELSLAGEVTIEAPDAERWEYPIETVAKSEKGFDRTMQGQAVVLAWDAGAGAARATLKG